MGVHGLGMGANFIGKIHFDLFINFISVSYLKKSGLND